MARLEIRTATLDDAFKLHPNLRELDRQELEASAGLNTGMTLARSVVLSEHPRAGVAPDGEVVALYGIVPRSILSDIGVPWMLASDRAAQYPKQIFGIAKDFTLRSRERYELLENYVDTRNGPSIRWLERLGYTIEPAVPHGAAGLPFHRFYMGSE